MNYQMNLRPQPFALIASGTKTIEIRLAEPKRLKIIPGDTITFINTDDTSLTITVNVINCYRFDTFEQLFEKFSGPETGFEQRLTSRQKARAMEIYYPRERSDQFGALAIEISR